jgi:hypothetical protein
VQTILNFFKKALTEPGMETSDWDTRLSEILLGYRASSHTSTGYSPALLTYGRELLLPAQLIAEAAAKVVAADPPAATAEAPAAAPTASVPKPEPIDLCSSDDTLAEDMAIQHHLEQAHAALETATPRAVANIAVAQEKQVREYKRRRGQQISIAERMPVNSFVKMKVQPSSKLDKGWEGPYQVVSYDERQTTVVLTDSAGKQWSRHVSLIAPYHNDV